MKIKEEKIFITMFFSNLLTIIKEMISNWQRRKSLGRILRIRGH
jgi:hypothetical protein